LGPLAYVLVCACEDAFRSCALRLIPILLGSEFRCVSYALDPFVKRSHVAVWVQRFDPRHLFCVRRVCAFSVDETYVKVGSFEAWVWVAVEPVHRFILGVYLSRHRNMLVAEAFMKTLVEEYSKHTVYSDGASRYPEACRVLGLKHNLKDRSLMTTTLILITQADKAIKIDRNSTSPLNMWIKG